MTTIAEEWRIVDKTSNYEISNYGQVRNRTSDKTLKPLLLGSYFSISLIINDKKTISKIHRLVATHFLICVDETHVVNHKDGIKTNNRVDNLEWVSRSENAKHAFRLGLNKGKKVKVLQYTLDNVFIKEYKSIADAIKETGVFKISRVCRGIGKAAGGYIWKYSDYVPSEKQPAPEGKTMTGFANYIITKDAKVYNSQRMQYLVSTKIDTGYMTLSLVSDDKKLQNFSMHRLVALLFIDNPNNCPEVNHIDFDKTNNHVSNLEWVSRSDNIKHNNTRVKN